MIDDVIYIQMCSKYLFQDDSFSGTVLDWDLRFGGSSSQGFNFLCTLSFPFLFPGCNVSYHWFCIFPLNFVHHKNKKYFTIWLLHRTWSGSTFQPSASFMDQPRERTALSTLETKRRGETIFWKGFAKNFSDLHRVLVVSYQGWSTTTLLPS